MVKQKDRIVNKELGAEIYKNLLDSARASYILFIGSPSNSLGLYCNINAYHAGSV